MASDPTPAVAPHVAVWEDFVDILYAPSAVYRRREHGSFLVPTICVALALGALFYLNSGAMRPVFEAEFDRQMAVTMRNNPKIPPEAMGRMREIGERVGQIGAFVIVPMTIFCVGLVTWLVGKLVDATETLRAAMVVAAYAFVPRVIEAALNGMQALALDPEQLDGRFRLSLGPGRFLDPDTASPLLLAFVGRLDLFTLWVTALVAIGVCVTGRVTIGRAAIAAALVWLVGALPLVLQALRTL